MSWRRSLEEEVESGRFRSDLYYRLNVVSIQIPPLRERRQDIPVLADHFLDLYSREHGRAGKRLAPEALDALVKYPYPGNIRELGNIVEQAVVLSRGDVIGVADLPRQVAASVNNAAEDVPESGNLDDRVAALERASLERALREADGNKSAAARVLGVSERKVRYMLRKYGMEE